MVYFLVHAKPPIPLTDTKGPQWARPLRELDWLGAALCIGMVVALFLPLQWGGATKPWRSPTIIALFCVSGVLIAMFVGWEWRKGEKALLPLIMFGRRTQVGVALESVGVPWRVLHIHGSLKRIFQFFNGMGLLVGTVRCWFYLQDICLSSV